MRDMSGPEKIPLFPLNTVLFPFGQLSLRIFEPRYLSMISERMKNDGPFGVVLIREGKEAGEVAKFHDIGTLARVKDFDQLHDGMLGISCVGEGRFKVQSHEVQPDNLVVARINRLDSKDSDYMPLENDFGFISNFVRDTLSQPDFQAYGDRLKPQWDNLVWLTYQVAELLPLSPGSRQLFLEMDMEEKLMELKYLLQDKEVDK